MTAPRPFPGDSPADIFRRPRHRPARQRYGPSAADPFPILYACLPDGYSYQPRLYHALSSCILIAILPGNDYEFGISVEGD